MNELARLLWRQVVKDTEQLPDKISYRARREAELGRCLNIADVRRLARRRVPRAVFDYADGAAWDERTARDNQADFQDWSILPHVLVNVDDVEMSTTLLGRPVSIPIIGAPTGSTGLHHRRGELAIASALHRAGGTYTASMNSSYSLEDLAREAEGPLWQQVYIRRDRSQVESLVQRASTANCAALVVTVDCARGGPRERDVRNAYSVPPRATLRTSLGALARPTWLIGMARCARFLPSPPPHLGNVSLSGYVDSMFDPTVSWGDIRWLRQLWTGPLVIKGILRPDDARRAVDLGVSAIAVSNHGGRQLDQAQSTVRALPAIVEAVGAQVEVYLDGGIRRGTDIFKALALGARAVMVGRPFVYGLGAGGDIGARRVVNILVEELRLAMVLAGCPSVDQLRSDLLVPAGVPCRTPGGVPRE